VDWTLPRERRANKDAWLEVSFGMARRRRFGLKPGLRFGREGIVGQDHGRGLPFDLFRHEVMMTMEPAAP
jgi:hypothetical protein